ncbi:hypothetical protein P175DRAFT_0289094 [Aspergillus ochraceoroseus IBT 24754]|uniref:Uncharacterized protein n=1 Tax=Aspergillus ochraceoroseus IBT 24754 TaxID=1392256 RepID=A0A2T5LSA4_9EURO|nr:uncharacterized protein P175DRAFT_0289094 [Aspergillus ochraceoroseus IBT 24754]PTU19162.1 hypothetical protein P175DRAFT_0289094 [Aspergillus ochraceoroseus IBT 24754]
MNFLCESFGGPQLKMHCGPFSHRDVFFFGGWHNRVIFLCFSLSLFHSYVLELIPLSSFVIWVCLYFLPGSVYRRLLPSSSSSTLYPTWSIPRHSPSLQQ